MTQIQELSNRAKSILNDFIEKNRKENIFNDGFRRLIVSLYATMPNSNPEVLDILKEYQVQLEDYLTAEDIDCLVAEYASVIEYYIKNREYIVRETCFSSNGQCHLPSSLIELCITLANPVKGKSIYLPFAGEGELGLYCSGCSIEGFEFDPKNWALSQIITKSTNSSACIERKESLNITNEKKYDYIFTFPPMSYGEEKRKLIDFVLQLTQKHLKEGGEFYAFLPLSFCNDTSGWFDVRKTLCWESHNKFSVSVIALPTNIIPTTSTQICLVKFAKNHSDKVTLVDASEDAFAVYTHNGETLKVKSTIETIQTKDVKYVWIGDTKSLNGDVNLLPARYLMQQNLFGLESVMKELHQDISQLDIVSLDNLIEIMPAAPNLNVQNEDKLLPLVGMRELKTNHLNCDIQIADLPIGDRPRYRTINEDCLLVGFIGGKFKVGRIHGVTPDNPITLRQEVRAFKIISDQISEDYLLYSMLSSFVEKQARVYSSGSTITRLSTKDLCMIKILVPDRNEQDRVCTESARKSLSEADRKLLESFEEYRKDIHMKRHAIGQTLFNLNNWWNTLQQVREEGSGTIKKEATTGKIYPISVSKIFDSLQNAIGQLQQQINKLDRGNGLVKEKFALTEFIEDYIEHNQSPLFIYKYESYSHYVDRVFNSETDETINPELIGTWNGKKEGKAPVEYVEFPPEALKIIIDNIVSNACCHGFMGWEDKLNIINFELKLEGDKYVIIISNNGSALHNHLKPSDVFIYGKSSVFGKSSMIGDNKETHYGIGGYEVQKLMREFGGDSEFISNPDSDYPVSYKLIFNNTNI